MGAQRPAHPQAPPAERGEPSSAEWTQQHYQCAASPGQVTGTRRTATGTRGARDGRPQVRVENALHGCADRHATGTPVGARGTHGPRVRHRPARNTTPQAPQGDIAPRAPRQTRDEHATGAPRRNIVPRAPRQTRHEHAAGAPGGTTVSPAPRRMPRAPGPDTGRAGHWLGRAEAPCRDCSRWVSPAPPPHPACDSHRTGRSMCLGRWISRKVRPMVRGRGRVSASRDSGSGPPARWTRR